MATKIDESKAGVKPADEQQDGDAEIKQEQEDIEGAVVSGHPVFNESTIQFANNLQTLVLQTRDRTLPKIQISEMTRRNAGSWWKRFEILLHCNQVVDEQDKFSCLISVVSLEYGDVALSYEKDENCYSAAKQHLQRFYSISKREAESQLRMLKLHEDNHQFKSEVRRLNNVATLPEKKIMEVEIEALPRCSKIYELTRHNAGTWWKMFEFHLRDNKVVEERDKFNCLTSVLPDEYYDIALIHEDDESCYTATKQDLQRCYCISKREAENQLNELKIYVDIDQFMHEVRQLNNIANLSEESIKEIVIEALPDSLYVVFYVTRRNKPLDEIVGDVRHLMARQATKSNVTNKPRETGNMSQQRGDSNTNLEGVCYYHRTYGINAFRCESRYCKCWSPNSKPPKVKNVRYRKMRTNF